MRCWSLSLSAKLTSAHHRSRWEYIISLHTTTAPPHFLQLRRLSLTVNVTAGSTSLLPFSRGPKLRSGSTVLNDKYRSISPIAVRRAPSRRAVTACRVGTWRSCVLARCSTIRHKASGVALETPLLIPSFSSKGFARSRDNGKSEIGKILAATSEFITESYLISAYDIHYQHVPQPPDLPSRPELLFLDSGGYEISTDSDYASVVDPLPSPHSWNLEKWREVVSTWPPEIPVVVISYDHHKERTPFAKQISAARENFKAAPGQLTSFLIKPETEAQQTLQSVLELACARAAELATFDVVGVTEKELGGTMLERMVRLARLRQAMDDASVVAPIHVFGALDPISVCLYYIAGGEIFDGLTWLRYAYHDGSCVYTHNVGAIKYGLHVRDAKVKSRTLADNYYALQDLECKMREFVATNNFDKLAPHSKPVSNARDSLWTRLKRST